MGRKKSLSREQELVELITNYEAAKAKNEQIYLDGGQLADIADRYAAEQRFDEAQEVVTYGLHLHPESTDLLMEQAYLYLDAQELEKAKEVAATITETYDPDVKMLKAELLLNEENPEEANELFNSIEDADDIAILTGIVYLFLDLGYPEYAQEWLEKGKSRNADHPEYITLAADYLFSTQQHESAIEAYNKLIDQDPYNASYWMGLAKCYFIEEKADKTIEACGFALAADEKCGEAYAYKAHSFFYLNNSEEAIKNYQKAMEYKAVPPELGYMFMGLAYAENEDWQKADESYTKVIKCFEKTGDTESILLIDTYTSKAFAVSHLERFEEAHQLCDKARKLCPSEGAIDLAEGKVYLIEEKEDRASEIFQKALKRNPGVEMCHMIASTYSESNYLDEAKEYYKMVYEFDPEYEMVREKLSILSLTTNEIDDFLKYNSECENPLDVDAIQLLLTSPDRSEEDVRALKEILKRMKNKNEKKIK